MLRIVIMLLISLVAFPSFGQDIRQERDGFKWIPYLEYGRIGAKSIDQKILVPAKYHTCYYENGFFPVKDNCGHMGLYSKDGKEIISVSSKYLVINSLKDVKVNSPFVVTDANGWGVVSHSGKIIIPPTYLSITPYTTSKGLFYVVVTKAGVCGVADANGNFIIKPEKYDMLYVNEVAGCVYISYSFFNNKVESGVFDEKGKELIKALTAAVIPKWYNGEIQFQLLNGNLFGYKNKNGVITKPVPNQTSYNSCSIDGKIMYITVNSNGFWGVVDSEKKEVIPALFTMIKYENGYFYCKRGRYVALYNKLGKCVVNKKDKYVAFGISKFNITSSTKKDTLIMAYNEYGKQAIYDKVGKKISEAMHKSCFIHVFNNNDTVLIYKDNGRYGVETLNHKPIIEEKYDDLNFLDLEIGNYFYVFDNGLVGLCDMKGNEIVEPNYSSIKYKHTKTKDYFLAQNDKYQAIYNIDGTQLINGETFVWITYDETKEIFTAINGTRTCKFSKEGTFLSDNSLDILQDKYVSIADDYFERKKYKLAAENYGLAISVKPTASLYFNRGVSYYNSGKYEDAIPDFYNCLNNNPSKTLRIRSLNLIDNSRDLIDQKEQRGNQIASAILGLALNGANLFFQSKMNKSRKASINNSYRSNGGNYSDDEENQQTTSSSGNGSCPSLRIHNGKWYCGNTGKCGMCNGDGLMDDGIKVNQFKCTLCGGTGVCKYCK